MLSAKALLGGADITVVADAVSAAQSIALAYGSPLQVRLQRAMVPSTKRAVKGCATAFHLPQGRRMAHIEVPKVRHTHVWCACGPRARVPCRLQRACGVSLPNFQDAIASHVHIAFGLVLLT